MEQIRLALFDIFRNVRPNAFFFLQMTVVFLMFSFSMIMIIPLIDGINQLKPLRNTQTYIVVDSTSNGKVDYLISNSEESVPKLLELYSYIVSSPVSQYTIWGYTTNYMVNGIRVEQKTANERFFELYRFEIIEGRMFNDEDFRYNTVTPVLVGYGLKDEYRLGNTYSIIDGGTGEERDCKVVGVLANNSKYPNIRNPMQPFNLNYTYLVPLSISEGRSLTRFSDLDMAINSTIFFTDDVGFLNTIKELSAELDLFSLGFKTAKESIDAFIDEMLTMIIYQLLITLIILIFACVGMASALQIIVKKNMRDYSIHIFCGGRMIDIFYRVILQVAIMLALSFIPTLIVFGLSLSTVYTVLLAILICVFVLIFPLRKLHSTSISTMIRTSE